MAGGEHFKDLPPPKNSKLSEHDDHDGSSSDSLTADGKESSGRAHPPPPAQAPTPALESALESSKISSQEKPKPRGNYGNPPPAQAPTPTLESALRSSKMSSQEKPKPGESKNSVDVRLHQLSVSKSLDFKKDKEKDSLYWSKMIRVFKTKFASRLYEPGRLRDAASFDLDFVQELMLHLGKKNLFRLQSVSKTWKSAFDSLHYLLKRRSKLLLLNLHNGIGGCGYRKSLYPMTADHEVICRDVGNTGQTCLLAFGGDAICYEDSGGFFRICNPKTRECCFIPFPEGGHDRLSFSFGFDRSEPWRGCTLTVGRLSENGSIKCSMLQMFTVNRYDILHMFMWLPIEEDCPGVLRGAGMMLGEQIFWLAEIGADVRQKPIVVLNAYSQTFHKMVGPDNWNEYGRCGLAVSRGKLIFTACNQKSIRAWQWSGSYWFKILTMEVEGDFRVLPRDSAHRFLLLEQHLPQKLKRFYLLDIDRQTMTLILNIDFPLNFEIGFCWESFLGFVGIL